MRSDDTRDAGAAGDLLGDAALTTEGIARACRVSVTWVEQHVEAGVLQASAAGDGWRFDSAMVVRARRIAQLEACFDADPQLAALTADLIEDVARLRRRLRLLGEDPP